MIKSLNLVIIFVVVLLLGCKQKDYSDENQIVSVEFPHVAGKVEIKGDDIIINVDKYCHVDKLTPVIEVSRKACLTPRSGVEQDFSVPVVYTVTSESGISRTYTIHVIKEKLSNERLLLEFTIPNTISKTHELPNGSLHIEFFSPIDITALRPFIKVSNNAEVLPKIGTVVNFEHPVEYTIIAEDGTKDTFTVSASVYKKSSKELIGFEFPNQTYTKTETPNGIVFDFHKIIDVSKITPLILVSSGATVTPESGVELDFSSPITFKITAEDGTEDTFTVSANVYKKSWKELISFEFPNRKYKKTETPNGLVFDFYQIIDLRKLTPLILVSSGAKVTPESGVELDFSTPITFNITAEDGSDTTFLVTAQNNLNPSSDILTFALNTPLQRVETEGDNIFVYVPNDVDVTKLTAVTTLSPKATVVPSDGAVVDFSTPVQYTVTSSDGSSKEYMVTVKLSPWRRLIENGKAPFQKVDGHRLVVYDDYLWLIGGWLGKYWENGSEYTNQVWRTKDGVQWENMGKAPWKGRHGFGCLAYDGKLWVICGDDNRDVWNTTDGRNWTLVNDNVAFGDRYFPYYTVFNNRMYAISGLANNWSQERYSDVWSSSDGVTWIQDTKFVQFPTRGMISGSIVYKNKLYIIGGGTLGNTGGQSTRAMDYNDVWSTADGVSWHQSTKEAQFAPRYWHSIGVHKDKMYVIAGFKRGHIHVNDVWSSTDGKNWTEQKYNFWAPRHAMSIASYNGKLYMVGGTIDPYIEIDTQNDVWVMEGDF